MWRSVDVVAIEIFSRKKYYGRQWLESTVWLAIFFKRSYFVFNRSKNS